MTTTQIILLILALIAILVLAFSVYEMKHAQEVDPDDETFLD